MLCFSLVFVNSKDFFIVLFINKLIVSRLYIRLFFIEDKGTVTVNYNIRITESASHITIM